IASPRLRQNGTFPHELPPHSATLVHVPLPVRRFLDRPPLRRLTAYAFTKFVFSRSSSRAGFVWVRCRTILARPKLISASSTRACSDTRSSDDFARRRHSDGASA